MDFGCLQVHYQSNTLGKEEKRERETMIIPKMKVLSAKKKVGRGAEVVSKAKKTRVISCWLRLYIVLFLSTENRSPHLENMGASPQDPVGSLSD